MSTASNPTAERAVRFLFEASYASALGAISDLTEAPVDTQISLTTGTVSAIIFYLDATSAPVTATVWDSSTSHLSSLTFFYAQSNSNCQIRLTINAVVGEWITLKANVPFPLGDLNATKIELRLAGGTCRVATWGGK